MRGTVQRKRLFWDLRKHKFSVSNDRQRVQFKDGADKMQDEETEWQRYTGQVRDHQQSQELKSLKGREERAARKPLWGKTSSTFTGGREKKGPGFKLLSQRLSWVHETAAWAEMKWKPCVMQRNIEIYHSSNPHFKNVTPDTYSPVRDVRVMLVSQQLSRMRSLQCYFCDIKDQNILSTACVAPSGMLNRWGCCNSEAIFQFLITWTQTAAVLTHSVLQLIKIKKLFSILAP